LRSVINCLHRSHCHCHYGHDYYHCRCHYHACVMCEARGRVRPRFPAGRALDEPRRSPSPFKAAGRLRASSRVGGRLHSLPYCHTRCHDRSALLPLVLPRSLCVAGAGSHIGAVTTQSVSMASCIFMLCLSYDTYCIVLCSLYATSIRYNAFSSLQARWRRSKRTRCFGRRRAASLSSLDYAT
jgi:hypothetical protein